jgi:hypothetical protein
MQDPREEVALMRVRVVTIFRDAASTGIHIWESANMGQVYVTSASSLATLLENALKQVETEDKGLRLASINLGLPFQPGCLLSPPRTS